MTTCNECPINYGTLEGVTGNYYYHILLDSSIYHLANSKRANSKRPLDDNVQ